MPRSVTRRGKRGSSAAVGSDARTAAAIVALFDGRAELPMLAALGVSTEVLDELFDAGILQPDGATHARLGEEHSAESILSELPWSARRRMHERIATALAGYPDRALEAARHFLLACKYPEARRYFVRFAESACRDRLYADAFAALDDALRIWPVEEDAETRLRIIREMVRCARNAGRHEVAARALREMLEMPAVANDPSAAASAHQQLADIALLDSDFSSVRRHLETAAQLAESSGNRENAARCWFAYASFLADQMRAADAVVAMRHAMSLAGKDCDPALRSEMLGFEGLVFAMTGRPKEAKARVEDALALAIEHKLSQQAAMAYRRRAHIREYCSDYAGEREAHLNAVALCKRKGLKETEQSCLVCLSYVFFRTGEWKRALEVVRRVAQSEAHPAVKAGTLGVRGMIAAFRGEHRQAIAQMEEAAQGLRRYGVLSFEFFLMWAQGFVLESHGDMDGAATAYSRMLDFWEDTTDFHDIVPGAMSAGAFFADRGDARRLGQATDILHAVLAANENEENRAARDATLGEAAALEKDFASAITHLTAARDGYDHLGTPIERALVRRRLARVLVAAGREREAADEREACVAIAREVGMRPLLAKVSDPVSTAAGTGAEALTARQRDVLHLLAAGLTNKEAADRLSLSPRTVEMHVASLLDRLNCRTRSEAIRRAGELGLLPGCQPVP